MNIPTRPDLRLTRRAALTGGAGLLAMPSGAVLLARPARAAPAPPGKSLAFRIMRHGSEIGRHVLHFAADGRSLTVRIAVDVLVTFASIPIVRYTHRGAEYWQDDGLVGLDGRTNRNGSQQWISARRAGPAGAGALAVTGSQTRPYDAPAAALPTTYWNRRMLSGPMISMEDGVLLHPHVADRGTEQVALASGAMIPATRHDITGDFSAIVWYDAAGVWASLGVTVADGSEIRYQRL